jgi:metallo-beta-lactamase class B
MAHLLLLLIAIPALAQREGWTRPYPAHTIAGNLHYVGTEDLACFLITTPEGHILINTGLEESLPLLRESIAGLGHKIEDVRILLTMQAHYDHTAGLTAIRKLSGARMFATEADAPSLEDGGRSDPVSGGRGSFPPVKVDRRLKDGDEVRLGGTVLRVILMSGHSKGSVGYSMELGAGDRKQNVLIVNMATVVMPLVNNVNYPGIVEDYRRTFELQKRLRPDIWVAAHASQYGMAAKHRAGSFLDPKGYIQAIARHERLFLEQLKTESR